LNRSPSAAGWDDGWEAAWAAVDAGRALQPVRIAAEHRGAYHALGPGMDAADGKLAIAWAELTGRTFHRAQDKRDLPTVGDWLLVEGWDVAVAGKGAAVIRERLPRRSLLVRKAAGEASVPQPLAANVDFGIVMSSANKDLSLPRLDRYLALLRDGGIEPVLLLSKIDLVPDPAPMIAALRELAPVVHAVSAVRGDGIAEVRALGGVNRTCVLLGSSGVGKSSLLNALVGEGAQLTQPIRGDERGRHTTTRRDLFVTDHGLWIDTPGMRELAQWIEDSDVAFDDITALAEHCKFRDCQHRAEPGCAVRDKVDASRLASFHKLLEERATGVVKQSAAQRLAETRKAKAKKYAPRGGKGED
jgi:ribosome biogenesis GTPase